jgi:hypothetical protein
MRFIPGQLTVMGNKKITIFDGGKYFEIKSNIIQNIFIN